MAQRTVLTAFAVALGVTAMLAGAGAWLYVRARAKPSGLEHAIIGDVLLTYPAGYARNHAAPVERLDRLDLAATFPDFKPAGDVQDVPTERALKDRAARTIFIAITPNDRSLDPTERPAKLYASMLDAIGYAQPSGLVLRRFQQGSPYEGEELYMTPPEGRSFWARCQARENATEATARIEEPCFTEMRMDGLNLTVRFAPAALAHWERLRDGVKALIAEIKR